jgi:hypothetical protein
MDEEAKAMSAAVPTPALGSILERTLRAFVARDLGVKPEEVTIGLTREWRRANDCNCSYETATLDGRDMARGLKVLTPREEMEILRAADRRDR